MAKYWNDLTIIALTLVMLFIWETSKVSEFSSPASPVQYTQCIYKKYGNGTLRSLINNTLQDNLFFVCLFQEQINEEHFLPHTRQRRNG